MSRPVPTLARVDVRGLDDHDTAEIVRAVWRTYLAAPTRTGIVQIVCGE